MALTEVSSSCSRKNGEITHKTIQLKDDVQMKIVFELTYTEAGPDEDLLEDEDKEQLQAAYDEFITDFIDSFQSVSF